MARKLVAEALGTAVLVIVGVGVATLSFGFRVTGLSVSAGVVATALAFGLVLLVLAYTLGPISGANVNPAVTLGFVLSRRMTLSEAAGYWGAQFVGAILGALVLWGIFSSSPVYSRAVVGLGANGWGPRVSMVGIGLGGAFAHRGCPDIHLRHRGSDRDEPSRLAWVAGLAIGIALAVVHLIGIPLTGTSVNPARSLGPAIIVGHKAISQVWLFIVAPLVGGALAALSYLYFVPTEPVPIPSAIVEGDIARTAATPAE